MDEAYRIHLDIDRTRIRDILAEAYKACRVHLDTEFDLTEDAFVSKINPYLDSNRVSTVVSINLPSKKYPELKLDINIQKKSIIARMLNKNKRVPLNRYLGVL